MVDKLSQAGLRGKLRYDATLADSNWFRVGGPAEILFKPEDSADLAACFSALPTEIPVTIIGVGSNLIVRDGGIDGLVVRLGRGFTAIEFARNDDGIMVSCGAAVLGRNLAWWCQENSLSGIEFLSGIPGTVGGAVAMNAGAYNAETASYLREIEIVTREGKVEIWPAARLSMTYRHSEIPAGAVVTRAVFAVTAGDKEVIAARINEIAASREATQPVRERTGGSTFKNPAGMKAWQLIDAAGCRGLRLGGAEISAMHCNFMINRDGATAAELEELGELVRKKVFEHSGIMLEWEIKRIGNAG